MSTYCGLDFGTSNSTIGICVNNICQMVPLEGNRPIMRSAIFCDAELKQWVFGQEGINNYLEGNPGRLMMALKSVLGSPLMEDKTIIFNEYISYGQILGHFIKHLKKIAEEKAGKELTQVVMGRPVHFHDSDKAQDSLAQNTLEKIARDLGFKDVSFQFEPIAAALTYEMSIQKEQIALIIDMGGGTSDFTVIRLRPGNNSADRSEDVLANCGIHIAGTDFDQRLSIKSVMPLLGMGSLMSGSSSHIEVPASYYYELTTWHTLNNLYSAKNIEHMRSIQTMAFEKQLFSRLIKVLQRKAGHHILDAVEKGKQNLSDAHEIELDLNFVESDLTTVIQQNFFNEIIADHVQKIIETIQQTVTMSGVKANDINAIFYTGGSTKIPLIRNQINALFPQAEIVQGDAFGSVGMGLTLEAKRRAC